MSLIQSETTNDSKNDLSLSFKKSQSINDLENSSPKSPSLELAASLNKLLILSNPNLRKSAPQLDASNDSSGSKSESPTIKEQQINLLVPTPPLSPTGVESRLKILFLFYFIIITFFIIR